MVQPETCVIYLKTPLRGQQRKCIYVSKVIFIYVNSITVVPDCCLIFNKILFVVESEREETHNLFMENTANIQVNKTMLY